MPFSDVVPFIPMFSQASRQRCQCGVDLPTEIPHAIAEPGTPGQKFRASRRADGVTGNRSGKRGAGLDECVQVRRPHERVAQRMDGIRTLVIGNDQQDIRQRLVRHRAFGGMEQGGQKNQQQQEAGHDEQLFANRTAGQRNSILVNKPNAATNPSASSTDQMPPQTRQYAGEDQPPAGTVSRDDDRFGGL